MTTREFFSKFASKYLWLNIFGMLLATVVIVFGLSLLANLYTRHGEEIKVPNMVNHRLKDMEALCEDKGLVIEINDSTYDPKYPAGVILKQNPASGAIVKEGHIIYVTINSLTIPTLEIPDLIRNSTSREAVAQLKVKKFKIGPIEFVPGDKDLVVGITCKGRQLKAGDRVSIYDVVVLQVGDGRRDASQSVEYVDPIERIEDASDVTDDEAAGVDVEPENKTDKNDDDFEEVLEE